MSTRFEDLDDANPRRPTPRMSAASPWQMTLVLALIMRLGLVLAYWEEWRSDDVIKEDVDGAAFVTN